jgi:cystathionine beta-lyase/cystathionine gamma-synthase
LPASPHGTVVSLPTLADVEGYERREPATWKHITAGYPRFVRNALVSQAAQQAAQQFGRSGSLFPLASRRAADRILAWAHVTDAHVDPVGDWVLVSFPEGPASEPFAKFVQHTGALISSRQAEAHLAGRSADSAETARALEQVRAVLSPYLASVKPADILVALAGMNAVAAGIAAVNDVQRPRGKRVWIQLGWLYVDSTRLFEKATDTQHVFVPDVTDLGAVERLLAQGDVAGVFTEIPNNPQLETADVYALRRLCDQYGAKLVLDPSSVGLASVDVLPPADIVCSSLTKYAASSGDVMAGVLAVNPARPDAEALLQSARSYIDAPYAADTIALAQQIVKLPAVTARLSQQATELAQRLAQHPAVSRVRTALTTSTAKNYQAMLRPGAGPGALITLELKADLRTVYDRLQVVKGPSFGLEFTLATPFLWLAHFSEVTTPEGREGLRRAGLDPDLLRVSVGLEPMEEILAAFAAALKK